MYEGKPIGRGLDLSIALTAEVSSEAIPELRLTRTSVNLPSIPMRIATDTEAGFSPTTEREGLTQLLLMIPAM
jgi:hypothetical protein